MPYTFQRLRHAFPALGPVRALLGRIPLGPLPSLHWLRRVWLPAVRSAGGLFRFVRRLHGYYGVVRLLVSVHHRLRLLVFPIRTRSAHGLWSDTRYPSFRRDPFARDVALDPGGMTMPRIPASLMLRSTIMTVSAPAISSFRGSLPHPTQPLCTLRVRRHRRLTQHSLPGGLLDLTWAGLAPADRASFCWRLPIIDDRVALVVAVMDLDAEIERTVSQSPLAQREPLVERAGAKDMVVTAREGTFKLLVQVDV